MSYTAGPELDYRVAGLCNWPDPTSFPYEDANFPELTSSVDYWRIIYEYIMWDRLPPGHRVICGITCPTFSATLALAQEAAALCDYDYGTETDPVAICCGLVAAME